MRTVLATAIVLFLAYSAFVAYGPRPTKARVQSQWEENSHVMEEYFRLNAAPSVVVTGSSLTKRLDFRAPTHCVYNLALSAGSALSGMYAIARGALPPRVVLVEINVPDRGADRALVAAASSVLQKYVPALATENIPANLFFGLLSDFRRGGVAASSNTDAGLADDALERELERQMERYRKPIAAEVLQRHLAEFESLVAELGRRSIDVVLFEMPIHPGLQTSPRATQIRAAFEQRFPGRRLLRYDELAGDMAIRTRDALHLTDVEAAVVATKMRSLAHIACPEAR